MKLSEAIRSEISMNIPQTRYCLFDLSSDYKLSACAASQALIGAKLISVEELINISTETRKMRGFMLSRNGKMVDGYTIFRGVWSAGLINEVTDWNDIDKLDLNEIAKKLEEKGQ